jgi:glutaredoxin 3
MADTVVWSKNGCPYCDQAKALLDSSGIRYEERNISENTELRETLLETLDQVNPGAPKTVPQIWLHGKFVGDYLALRRYYEEHNMYIGNQGL